jgi:threonine/homoserine efflux transporter RhtA
MIPKATRSSCGNRRLADAGWIALAIAGVALLLWALARTQRTTPSRRSLAADGSDAGFLYLDTGTSADHGGSGDCGASAGDGGGCDAGGGGD